MNNIPCDFLNCYLQRMYDIMFQRFWANPDILCLKLSNISGLAILKTLMRVRCTKFGKGTFYIYVPALTKWKIYWFTSVHHSVRPFFRPSVFPLHFFIKDMAVFIITWNLSVYNVFYFQPRLDNLRVVSDRSNCKIATSVTFYPVQ